MSWSSSEPPRTQRWPARPHRCLPEVEKRLLGHSMSARGLGRWASRGRLVVPWSNPSGRVLRSLPALRCQSPRARHGSTHGIDRAHVRQHLPDGPRPRRSVSVSVVNAASGELTRWLPRCRAQSGPSQPQPLARSHRATRRRHGRRWACLGDDRTQADRVTWACGQNAPDAPRSIHHRQVRSPRSAARLVSRLAA